MTLLQHMNSLEKIRIFDFPENSTGICLLIYAEELGTLPDIMAAHPQTPVRVVMVMQNTPIPKGSSCSFEQGGKKIVIPLAHIDEAADFSQLDFVQVLRSHLLPIVTGVARKLRAAGIKKHYILVWGAQAHRDHVYNFPEYYEQNADELEKTYALLADEASREVYAATVKAMTSGDNGYLPVSLEYEYYHPLVRPEAGDVMIDGGVSSYVQAQLRFCESVGAQGKIYGFEPIPRMCSSAAKSLRHCPQYRIFPMGLGDKREQVFFRDNDDASQAASEHDENTVLCDLIDIDGFMDEHKIRRLNCIKLDVEGAELAALHGAEKTIRSMRPKLIICLYHRPEDLYAIPAYIKSIVPEYEFYIAHSSFDILDTILHAKVPG